jgi:hypothetical protein
MSKAMWRSWTRRETEHPEHLRIGPDENGTLWYVSHDRFFSTYDEARDYAQQVMADWPLHPGDMLTPELRERARRID